MVEASSSRRSVRQASSRKRSLYAEVSEDDDYELSSGSDDLQVRQAKAAKTGTRSRPSRAKTEDVYQPPMTVPQASSRKASSRRSKPGRPKGTASSSRQQQQYKPIKRKFRDTDAVKQGALPRVIDSDGRFPEWQLLPYEILLEIFSYATTDSTRAWLLQTARKVCRAFAEPALTAWYLSPLLPTSSHVSRFQGLLELPKAEKFMDYNVKTKQLELDAGHLPITGEPLEWPKLISQLPLLNDIRFISAQDQPPYRRHSAPKWRYPEALFEGLEVNSRRLKAWRWNSLFISSSKKPTHQKLCDYMNEMHLMPCFQSLEHLEISDFPALSRLATEQPPQEIRFAQAISILPNLQSLSIESCDMLHAPFLSHLPRSLRRLKIANCSDLTSDMLQSFLAKGGFCELRHLVLNHNPSLELAFLPTLKTACPHLETLKMDLHYYSPHHTVENAEPRYEYLLGADEVPTWPSTLQKLELVHLQKWDSEGAQNLFGSLIDSAQGLPSLRSIVLHAHISIAWRDRAAFRERWIDRLHHVYLRRPRDPDPHLASFKTFRKLKELGQVIDPNAPAPSTKRVSVEIGPVVDKADASDDEPLSKKRRSKRIAVEAAKDRASSDSAAHEMSVEAEDVSDEGDGHEDHVQGLCNIVDIRIDNQRPREEQYNESHFLDSEASGDEDWNEGDDMPEDNGYAW